MSWIDDLLDGVDPNEKTADFNLVCLIENKLLSSCYGIERRKAIDLRVAVGMPLKEAYEILAELELNQVDPITAGWPHSKTELTKHINKLM